MRFEIDNLGYRWKGNYDPASSYIDNDVVFHAGGAYYFKNGVLNPFQYGVSDAESIGELLVRGREGVAGSAGQRIEVRSDGYPAYRFPIKRNGTIVKELNKNVIDYSGCSAYPGHHGCAVIMMDGSVRFWGRTLYGQGGTGRTDDISRSRPALFALPSGVKAKKLFNGMHVTYVIDQDDYLWSCGYQYYHGTGNQNSSHVGLPTRIDGFGDIPAETKFKFAGQIHDWRAGGRCFAVTLDGNAIYWWGYNDDGANGVGTNEVDGVVPYPRRSLGLPDDIVIDKVYGMGGANPGSYIIDENGILYTAGEYNANFHQQSNLNGNYEFKKFHPWGDWNTDRKVVQICATENVRHHASTAYTRATTITFSNGDYFHRSDNSPQSNYFGTLNWNRPFGLPGETPENTNVKEAYARNGEYMTHWILKNDGSVWSKGYNGFNVHDGSSSNGTWTQWEFPNAGEYCIKLRVAGGAYVSSIGVLSNLGRLYIVGAAYEGLRGIGNTSDSRPADSYGTNAGLYPVLSDKVFIDFCAMGSVNHAYGGSADGHTSCTYYGLTVDGEVYAWGYGGYAALADDDSEWCSTPQKIIF